MHRRTVATALLAVVGLVWSTPKVLAQSAATTGATVEGRVYDSLAHAPLSGAAVNLVSADARPATYSAISDSTGRYVLHDVAPGAYLAGFFHPLLDSIGIQSPVHRVTIADASKSPTTRVDLGVPSGDHIRDAVCGARAKKDSSGVFVGHVQDAATNGVLSGATITAQWWVVNVVGGRLVPVMPTASVKSGANGWFAFCGLPAEAPITFVASFGADSSGQLSLNVPAHRATHRDLFVGAAHLITRQPVDSTTPDSLRVPPEILHRGPALLHGVIRDAASHQPLPEVQVTVVGTGLTTMANERGEFTLSQLPLGTQTLAARKVGYLPTEHLIDLLAHDTAGIALELPTIKSVMDTVRVTASRVYSSDRNGFYRRQRTGLGHYFDAAQIERINPFETSMLVTRIPGVRTTSSGNDRTILMRSAVGSCVPSVFIDGFLQNGMTVDDLDRVVHPDQIEGIEIYTSFLGIPPEFIQGLNPCGVVAVWTQDRKPRPRTPEH